MTVTLHSGRRRCKVVCSILYKYRHAAKVLSSEAVRSFFLSTLAFCPHLRAGVDVNGISLGAEAERERWSRFQLLIIMWCAGLTQGFVVACMYVYIVTGE